MISNYELFHPVNTGAPRQDVYNHIARLPQPARLDFEEHTLAGNLILRIEAGLGGETEAEAESKIVSLPYAFRTLGNTQDAAEFIRCVRLIAGDDARAYNLQIVAAHYYQEARTRPVAEVLKEMALLALELSAVTATRENLLCDEVESASEAWLTPDERRELWQHRTAQVLGETETATSYFEAELSALARMQQHTASGLVYDECAAHLAAEEAVCETLDEVDALYAAYEAVHEQYDEGQVVSLHMSDGERVVVVGKLDDDVDEDSLPAEARPLAQQMFDLYTTGFPLHDAGPQNEREGLLLNAYRRDPRTGRREAFPVEACGLDTWLDYAVDELYHERVERIARQVLVIVQPGRAPFLHEQTYTVEVCPDAAERTQTRAVLETLLARWRSDYHTRALHDSAVYRDFDRQLRAARDTAVIARLKREAWQHKEQGGLSLKLFTAWLTRAKVREAHLISRPLRETRESQGQTRAVILAQPLLHRIAALSGATINDFNQQLAALPRQEQNRVRAAAQQENPTFYARVRDGLQAELRKSSPARLRYFKWAFYGANKLEHPFHLLTPDDQAAAWSLLKELSQNSAPKVQPQPIRQRTVPAPVAVTRVRVGR